MKEVDHPIETPIEAPSPQISDKEELVRRQLSSLLQARDWDVIIANLEILKSDISNQEWLAAKLANYGLFEIVAQNFSETIVKKVIPGYVSL